MNETTSDHRLRERFRLLWERLGAHSTPADDIVERYSEPGRSYHGVAHLQDCLTTFDEVRDQAEQSDRVEVAIWYHDAIYDPRRPDNESRSADLAVQHASNAGLSPHWREDLHALVMATDHRTPPVTPDELLIIDIDLTILAADRTRFDRYEREIRHEYAWVPIDPYRAGRSQVLRKFLERDRIYRTKPFRSLEGRARENLERALTRLEG